MTVILPLYCVNVSKDTYQPVTVFLLKARPQAGCFDGKGNIYWNK